MLNCDSKTVKTHLLHHQIQLIRIVALCHGCLVRPLLYGYDFVCLYPFKCALGCMTLCGTCTTQFDPSNLLLYNSFDLTFDTSPHSECGIASDQVSGVMGR